MIISSELYLHDGHLAVAAEAPSRTCYKLRNREEGDENETIRLGHYGQHAGDGF